MRWREISSLNITVEIRHTICLIAISNDFLEIVLPKPLLSAVVIEDFMGFRIAESDVSEGFRGSCMSDACPLEWIRPLPGGSVNLPLLMMGDECLLVFTGPMVS